MNDPDTALATILSSESSYESDTDYGMPVTMEYIVFDANGAASNLTTSRRKQEFKVTVESQGYNLNDNS